LILLIPGLDYKKLTTADSPLQVLKPVLTSANVHLLAKLATKIPTKVGCSVYFQVEVEKINSTVKLLKNRNGKKIPQLTPFASTFLAIQCSVRSLIFLEVTLPQTPQSVFHVVLLFGDLSNWCFVSGW